jgi:gliding motility-associated-like protein
MNRSHFLAVLFLFAFGIVLQCNAQQTARMTSGGNGYLEKLPPDYATNPIRKYPVLFFLHGSGETGSGSPADLEKVKLHGPPKLIQNGHNMCFMVNGVEECFIVISPQLRPGLGGWWPSVLNDVFNYVLSGPQNYRIDMNRVYLTGLSLGGQGVYIGVGDPAVANIFAAGAPVSGFGNGNGCSISSRKIPMWGFHGTSDGSIPYSTGLSEFNNIQNCTTPAPTAELKWTSYAGQGHDIWENFAYRTDNNLHTPNLYQWLLTKSKNSAPTANAGADITLTLPNNSTIINGSGLDPGGSIASYAWTKTSGGAATLTNATSPSLTVSDLVEGTYVFRLTVTDNEGNPGSDDVTVIVKLVPTIVITNPIAACSPATVDITASSITIGSTPNLTYTYWTNASATISYLSPTTASSGTYYIKGITLAGGSDIKPVTVTVNPSPNLVITNPPSVCPFVITNLTLSSVTAGSTPGLNFSYWTNAGATTSLTNPTSVASGTYYIKGTNTAGCSSVKPVTIGANPGPTLSVTNPASVCTPSTVDLTAASITVGSSSGLTFSYWTNASATTPLVNPTTATSGNYYIKGTNSAGCADIKPVTVIVNTTPNLVINNPPSICAPATSIDLTAPSITAGSSAGLTFSYWTNAGATNPLTTPTTAPAGTFYIKVASANGCSDIKSVTVTVNSIPNLVITNPTAVCTPATVDLTSASTTVGSSSGLTFSYWTNASTTNLLSAPTSVAQSGTYYIKATNTTGCVDVKSVIVTVNVIPNLIITNPNPVCAPNTVDLTSALITFGSASGLTFSYWIDSSTSATLANPLSVSSSGTFFIKATAATSCASVKPVVVTINAIPSVVINDPAVCLPSTADLTAPSITTGSAAGLNYSYWVNPEATFALSNPRSVTIGTYYVKGTNSSACFDIKPVTVMGNPSPNLVITNPTPVCEPATIDLTVSSITAGSTSGLIFSYWTNTTATTTLSNPESVTNGTYYVKGTNDVGCADIAEVIAEVKPMPQVITSPISSNICSASNANIQLSTSNVVPGGVAYSWTSSLASGNAQGYSDGNGASIAQYLTSSSSGIVRYTIQSTSVTGGCVGTIVTTDVSINPAPEVSVNSALSTSLICNGCSTNIILQNPNNIPGTNFSWIATVINGNVTGQSSGSGNTITQTLSKTSTNGIVRYTVTPKAGDCQGNPITYDVRINLSPTANAGPDLKLTPPTNTIVINGSANDTDGAIASYVWSKVDGPASFKLENQTTSILTVKDLIAGTYRFKLFVQDNDGASGLDEMTLVVAPKPNTPPVVSAGPDINLQLPTNQVSITGSATDADGTIKSVKWSQLSGPAASMKTTETKLDLSDLTEGSYLFRFSATDNNDATVSDDVSVSVARNDFTPISDRKKFFTPNGDGQNDYWVLDADVSKFSSCKLVIVGTDGSKIIETTGYQNNWDGTHNGKPLPQDVYYYILDCNGSKDSGSITIIR